MFYGIEFAAKSITNDAKCKTITMTVEERTSFLKIEENAPFFSNVKYTMQMTAPAKIDPFQQRSPSSVYRSF
ncbi:hypothetical protein TH62_13890 [Bacillus sp. TH008]|nr:hypothetical protein TH62_13890 [Bacillus sp. TH008]